MPAAIVQQNEGTSALATTAATLAGGAVAGNLIVLIVGADDYRTAVPTGFTESTGCRQETFLGHYVWWKVAAGGETSISYTIGSASPSCWETFEISGLEASPYDVSAGQLAASSATSYTTPAITPTSGARYLIASIGGSLNAALSGVDTWLNSFTEQNDSFTTLGSGTRDVISMADRSVTGDGATTFSSGATYSGAVSCQSRTGIIISFKVASGGTSATATPAAIATTVAAPRAALNTSAGPAVAATVVAAPRAAVNAAAGPAVAATVAATPRAALNVSAGPAAVASVVAMPRAGLDVAAGPGVVTTAVALPQPAVNSTVGAQVFACTVALPAAAVSAGGSATAVPAAIACTVAVPRPAVDVGAGPAVVAATVAVPAGTVNSTVGAVVLAVSVALPAASVAIGVTAAPAAIAATVTLPGAAVHAGAGPAVIAVTVALPLADTGGVPVNATSTPEVVARVAAVAAVAALRASTSTVARAASSTSTVGDG